MRNLGMMRLWCKIFHMFFRRIGEFVTMFLVIILLIVINTETLNTKYYFLHQCTKELWEKKIVYSNNYILICEGRNVLLKKNKDIKIALWGYCKGKKVIFTSWPIASKPWMRQGSRSLIRVISAQKCLSPEGFHALARLPLI